MAPKGRSPCEGFFIQRTKYDSFFPFKQLIRHTIQRFCTRKNKEIFPRAARRVNSSNIIKQKSGLLLITPDLRFEVNWASYRIMNSTVNCQKNKEFQQAIEN